MKKRILFTNQFLPEPSICICRIVLTMETYSKSPQFEKILEKYERTVEDMSNYLEILREWMKKQPHLPSELLSDDFLEISLIQNKMCIQKTKMKIEKYCSYKSMKRYEHLFEKELFVIAKEPMTYVPIPRLTDDYKRIFFTVIWDEEKYDPLRSVSMNCVLRDIYSRYDYNDGEIHIIDCSRATPNMLMRANPIISMDGIKMTTEVFSARLKEIHIISKFGSTVFNFVKPLFPSKIRKRITLHENTDELKKFIPSKCLPLDYGGESKSIAELLGDYDDFIELHREEFLGYLHTKSREDKRIGGPLTDELDGSFRKLNID